MLKEATYKEKFSKVSKWVPRMVEAIKKDLKNEHLKNDAAFVRTFFPGKNSAKLTTEELVEGYSKALADEEGGEHIAEFMTNRWLLKNSELYYFFEQELKQVNPDFQSIEQINDSTSRSLIERAVQEFSIPEVYLFCVLNSVAFSEKIFSELSQRADQSKILEKKEEINFEQQSLEEMQKNFTQQIERLTDKYEKKLIGMQKKYIQDTSALKKQIAALQRKLS